MFHLLFNESCIRPSMKQILPNEPESISGQVNVMDDFEVLFSSKNSTIYLSKDKQFILKRISGKNYKDYFNEVKVFEILQKFVQENTMFSLENIIMPYNKTYSSSKKEGFLLFPYCGMDALEMSRYGDITELMWWEYVQQIYNTLTMLHAAGLVHMDLKPENIVYDNGYWKLIDYGQSQLTSKIKRTSSIFRGTTVLCGTSPFVVPRVTNIIHTDIYAYCLVLFETMGVTFKEMCASHYQDNPYKNCFCNSLKINSYRVLDVEFFYRIAFEKTMNIFDFLEKECKVKVSRTIENESVIRKAAQIIVINMDQTSKYLIWSISSKRNHYFYDGYNNSYDPRIHKDGLKVENIEKNWDDFLKL